MSNFETVTAENMFKSITNNIDGLIENLMEDKQKISLFKDNLSLAKPQMYTLFAKLNAMAYTESLYQIHNHAVGQLSTKIIELQKKNI